MVTKNFLFILRCNLILIASIFLASCSSLKTREDIKSTPPPSVEKVPQVPEALRPPEVEPVKETSAPPATSEMPKIGLILGPGSNRAYAHVGVVQELAKAKLPITHVVGFEMGALVGAIFAAKGQPFDVEWQMFKLKDFQSLTPFLQTVFQGSKTEDFKIPFACPSYNLAKQQNYMMNRGVTTQMLPYCLSTPPLLKPFNQTIAGVTELKTASDYLKAKGANFIVYVHILGAKNGVITGKTDDESNIMWNVISQNLAKQWQGIDHVITVPVQDYDLLDFGKRREMLQKGLEVGQTSANQIVRKLGL